MNEKVNLPKFVENIYKNYSLYVLESRSIPDWTGIKRSQIKLLWVANDKGRKLSKTLAFTGIVVAYGNYHHAPDALSETASKMVQDFTGGNNIPLLEGKGSFGCQTVPDGVAAPRYTEIKLHENFDHLFPNVDFNIIPESIDPENPEPEYLAPLLPITLINGAQGIAIGYATKIFPRNPLELIDLAINIIDGKKRLKEIDPFYIDYRGKIIKDENDKTYMIGRIQKLNKKNHILIDEVPLKYNLESYKNFLYKLKEEKKIVRSIVKDESDSKYNITIKVTDEIYNLTEDQLIDIFDLKMVMNENITLIGKYKEVKVFDTAVDYMKYFIENRITLYDNRIEYLINKNTHNIIKQMIKLFLIEYINSGKEKTKDKMLKDLNNNFKTIKEYFKYNIVGSCINKNEYEEMVKNIVSNIRLVESFIDKEDEYNQKLNDLIEERNNVQSKTKEEMYKDDLNELKKYIKKEFKNKF